MAKTTNTAVVVSAKPTIAQIAAMSKAERAYIAMRRAAVQRLAARHPDRRGFTVEEVLAEVAHG